MSDVFISYARSTVRQAEAIAKALRALGYGVWRDDELPAHRGYSEVIEERLHTAKAVLVLWSAEAVKSQWVRAEADLARRQDKLVQATLDGTLPPLPFDQIQCAQLEGWRGADSAQWRKVRASLDELIERPSAPQAATPPERPRRFWRIGVTVLGVALMALAAWRFGDRLPRAEPPASRVAILPFRIQSQSPQARIFAEGLSDQIQSALTGNQFQVISRDEALGIAGPDRARQIHRMGVRLVFDGAVQDDGNTTSVTVRLDDAVDHTTLWSAQFSGATARPADLQAQIGGRIVAVLNCSTRALSPKDGLTDTAMLIQYLRACDLFAGSAEDDPQLNEQMLAALQQVTKLAPRFPPAHAALAKFMAYRAGDLPADQAAASRKTARQEAARALAEDPKNADAYVALYMLEPHWNWEAREALLRKGVAGDPSWPHANGFLALLLTEMGRLREAVTYGRRAAAENTLGETWVLPSALILADAGEAAEADQAITQYERLRPGSSDGFYFELPIRLQETRWDDALALLQRPADHLPTGLQDVFRLYIAAGKSRSPAAIQKARAVLLETSKSGGGALSTAITDLSQLGLVDDAFALAEQYGPGRPTFGDDMSFMFDSRTAAMRRDPRFLQLAERVGLLAYWRKSGKWPDFCHEPGLPYACR